jgi:hypothetical protein
MADIYQIIMAVQFVLVGGIGCCAGLLIGLYGVR